MKLYQWKFDPWVACSGMPFNLLMTQVALDYRPKCDERRTAGYHFSTRTMIRFIQTEEGGRLGW
jgi:hypothetical protein